MSSKVLRNGTIDKQELGELVQQYDASSVQFPEEYFYDYGSEQPFSLAGRGPGECGAGVMDVIKVDIDEAKQAVKAAQKATEYRQESEYLYNAVLAAARALLFIFGLELKKDREIFSAFKENLIEPGWVKSQTQSILDDSVDWRMGDKSSIVDLTAQIHDLIKRIEELFLSLDANLKFKAEPIAKEETSEKEEAKNYVADLRGVACPLNFVKAKLELEKIDIGEVLEILLDKGEPFENVPASFSDQGQEVLQTEDKGDCFSVKVRRIK
ncbi:MAG: sulfurtransferase TusA family protein [Planctomycetota bacterium]